MSFSVYNWEYDSALIKGSALLVLFRKPESDDALADGHHNVLLIIENVSHRRGLPQMVRRKVPQHGACRSICCHERAAILAEENQSGRCG